MNFLLIAAGGFLGAISRYSLSILFNNKTIFKQAGTWLANISGTIILSFLWIRIDKGLSESVWLFAGIGFSGAFTTFSTFGKETLDMLENGDKKGAISYTSLSVFGSLSVAWTVLALFS